MMFSKFCSSPMKSLRFFPLLGLAVFTLSGCGRKAPPAPVEAAGAQTPAARHEHRAPHGGAAVALGDEAYHLEFVLDQTAGKLTAFVLDGEMDKYIRVPTSGFAVLANVAGASQPLAFKAVGNSATGEVAGDTSTFEATAEWLKTVTSFDAVLTAIEIRGSTFSNVAFNFPKGND
jgi:predicted small lipoprotein YifL